VEFSVLLALVFEVYFGLTAKPYLFGFPRIKWPLFAIFALLWAASFGAAYYFVFGKRIFYG
jgi:hypothetical protein